MDYLGTKLIGNKTAFLYTPPEEEHVIILGLHAEALENLLSEIGVLGEYAESDVLTDFSALPQEIQLTYMQLLASVIRENGNSLHEVYRLAVQYSLNEYCDRISAEPDLPFEDALRDYAEQIPYPNEEALAISLLKDLCTVYQYTKDFDILTLPEKKYFPLIFNGSTEERERYTDYTEAEQALLKEIQHEIIAFMKDNQKTCSEKKLSSNARLVEDLLSKEWDKVLSNLTFSNSEVRCDDIIGLYDPTFSGAIFGNFMGVLFLLDGICFRKNMSTPIQQMSYLDMVAMDEKLTSVIVYGESGEKITFNAINYSKIVELLQKIVKIAQEQYR